MISNCFHNEIFQPHGTLKVKAKSMMLTYKVCLFINLSMHGKYHHFFFPRFTIWNCVRVSFFPGNVALRCVLLCC